MITREKLALIADTSLSGLHATRKLDHVIAERGTPSLVVSDEDNEFRRMAILKFVQGTRIGWQYKAPELPTENVLIESINGNLRDECVMRKAPNILSWGLSWERTKAEKWKQNIDPTHSIFLSRICH